MGYFEEARAKLDAGRRASLDKYGNAMKDSVADALLEFCRQDGEFAQAVAQGGSFEDCMKAEAEKLRAEAEALRKQLAMSSQEIVIFKLRFSAWQEAHKLMAEAFAALPDEETKEKMRAAIRAQVKAWG